MTFFGLTGPSVIKSVLGENVTPDELGGPNVHSQTGVTDYVVDDEVQAIRKVRRCFGSCHRIMNHGSIPTNIGSNITQNLGCRYSAETSV